jgi:phosphopantetheine adenylyltransferase
VCDTNHYLVVLTATKKLSNNWRKIRYKNKLNLLYIYKIVILIEANKYRNIVSNEVIRVNKQPCNAANRQETRWKNIKDIIDIKRKGPKNKRYKYKKND